MATCVNHPEVETDTLCANCGRPFCDSCLVEFMGARYCGPCRDLKLAEMQAIPSAPTSSARLAGTGTVDIGGWLNRGWGLIGNDLPAFALATLLAFVLTVVSCSVLAGGMYCGLMMVCFQKMSSGRADAGTVMAGVRRLGNAFLFMLCLGLLSFGVSLAVEFVMGAVLSPGIPDRAVRQGMVEFLSNSVSFVLSVFLEGATFFALPLIASRNVGVADAIRESWTVFLRNPLGFCLTGFVFQLVAGLGVVGCVVGLLITVPLATAARVMALEDHFGVGDWLRA